MIEEVFNGRKNRRRQKIYDEAEMPLTAKNVHYIILDRATRLLRFLSQQGNLGIRVIFFDRSSGDGPTNMPAFQVFLREKRLQK